MSDQSQSSPRGNSGLAFIVGALVVAVGVLAYVFLAGGNDSDDLTITIDGGADAVESVGAAAEGAAAEVGSAIEGAADAATGN